MTKREARAQARTLRAAMDMQAVGRGMAAVLFPLPCWAAAGTVLAFAAMPDEPDTAAILCQALADGKHLLLPRVLSKTAMDWVEIPDLALLRPGAFGILEPPADLPAADPAVFARPLALIPCLAAGHDGVRLGRGGGYYDRFLSAFRGVTVGICYTACTQWRLPHGRYDRQIQLLITEKYIRRTYTRGAENGGSHER